MIDTKTPKPEQLLGKPITADYMPSGYSGLFLFARNRPPFSMTVIQEMLGDPRVIFGLWLIKGPILANSRFYICILSYTLTEKQLHFALQSGPRGQAHFT